ncbi:MAG: hypothetical protein HS106_09195 [Ideonella sp.]|nr:MAG: hypothetical protein F9K36_02950 [Burkholderiaceae bacterium]MBE7426208.1 hypothetical protein [Ideonella sp.]
MADNPYLGHLKQALPRLLSLFDGDRTSDSHGVGDRLRWAWGLIDFGNATYQGAAHGLARLWSCGMWPYATAPDTFFARIDAMFDGARRLTRSDGSLEEAFPFEGSFCVTALVAFDLLCALQLLKKEIPAETERRWQSIIEPWIQYLMDADEAHAVISNHLATAASALARWHALTGDEGSLRKARELTDRILAHQSKEGWFREYDGADPGYQSLCTYYLADLHAQRPDWQLYEPLRRSIAFLWHFAHPDGSFGGVYGSRCTRFYFPAGLEALAREIPEAAALARFMRESIRHDRVVTLSCMDDSNLVPMLNAYCVAAQHGGEELAPGDDCVLPALRARPARVHFAQAGLWLDAGPRHYTVIGTHVGGVVMHFVDGRLMLVDAGVVVRDARGRMGSSQALDVRNRCQVDGDDLVVEACIRSMPRRLPTPMQFLLLRLLCVTAFRWRGPREWVKRRLVAALISPQNPWPAANVRRIHLGAELSIDDRSELPAGYRRLATSGAFVSIHMASQGYWQRQDEASSR